MQHLYRQIKAGLLYRSFIKVQLSENQHTFYFFLKVIQLNINFYFASKNSVPFTITSLAGKFTPHARVLVAIST